MIEFATGKRVLVLSTLLFLTVACAPNQPTLVFSFKPDISSDG
jgi:hypothetical protein